MKTWLLAVGVAGVLVGCSVDEEAEQNADTAEAGYENTNDAIGHGIEDDTVGFTLDEDGTPIAVEVPVGEEAALLEAYNTYINAFNAEDIDAFMNVLADEPEGFDREEDKELLMDTFAQYETTYEPSDMTIVKYEENRAEVFAAIDVTMTDAETDNTIQQTGRQVVVFEQEDGEWRVSALHFIGNQ